MRLGMAHAGVLAALWLAAGANAQPPAPPETAGPQAAESDPAEPGATEPDESASGPSAETTGAPASAPMLPEVAGPLRPDTDADGFFDPIDACPALPEVRNGFEDDDGCPDVEPLGPRRALHTPLPDWDEDERRWIAEDEREQCRDWDAVAGGIVLLVVGAPTLLVGVAVGATAGMYRDGDEPSDGVIAASVLSLALGAAGVGVGVPALISGSSKRRCSETAHSPPRPLIPQVALGPAGSALRWSF